MSMVPLTVALMTYNRSHYLKEAMQGILAQTYRNFEFLILDNASSDDTPSVVLGCGDPRIRYVRNAPGYTALFNGISAMKIARGKRIIITHDDDIMMPDMLQRQMAFMDEHPDMMAVWTNVSIIDEAGKLIQPYHIRQGEDRIYALGEYLSRFPEEQLLPLPSTLMLDKKNAAGVHMSSFYTRIYHDDDLAKRQHKFHGGDDVLAPALMNTRGSVAFLNEPLLKYRRHSTQNTNDVHISRPVLNTYKLLHHTLRKHAARIPGSGYTEPVLGNHVARYAAQHEVVNLQAAAPGARMQEKLATLLEQGLENAGKNGEAFHPLLPLMLYNAQQSGNAKELFAGLPQPHAGQSSATHALYRWAMLLKQGLSLFASVPGQASIAILGSSMVAALLVTEAKARGLKVVCLDSKPSRQNRKMLGIPILAPEQLRRIKVDYVILSSEREQDDYLHQFIHGYNPDVKVLSWKDLSTDYPSKPSVEASHARAGSYVCE